MSTLINYSLGCLSVEGQLDRNNGIHQVVQPHRMSNFNFDATERLVYAEAGNTMVENLVVGRSSCKRTMFRAVSNEYASDSTILEE